MKLTNYLLCIVVCLGVGAVQAQTVATIGVGDITYSAGTSELRPKENVISALDSGLNEALLNTRKFTVLNYAALTERLQKQGLNLDGYYNKSYTGTEYSQAGLDYILTADVTDFGLQSQARGSEQSAESLVEIEFKLIGVADVTSDIESDVSAKISKQVSEGSAASGQLLDEAIDQAVEQLVDKVISSLFPIRVMQIAEDGEIKLNYGAGVLAPGDKILIYPLDKELVFDEGAEVAADSIATLQIVASETKFARAKALDGLDQIVKGQQGQLLLTGE